VEFCAGDLISASKVYNLAYNLEIFLLACFIVVLKDGETGLLKKNYILRCHSGICFSNSGRPMKKPPFITTNTNTNTNTFARTIQTHFLCSFGAFLKNIQNRS
jgi:hypothetical protein